MTSNLTQFHFLASTVQNKFDFEAEDFDVGQIYQFYSLKVSLIRLSVSSGLSNHEPFHFIASTHPSFPVPRQDVCQIVDQFLRIEGRLRGTLRQNQNALQRTQSVNNKHEQRS